MSKTRSLRDRFLSRPSRVCSPFPRLISHPVRSLSTAWLLPQLPSTAGLRLSVSSLSVSRLAAAQPLFGSLFRLPGRTLKEFFCWNCRAAPIPMVGSSGLEPPTSRLSGVRSNRLSYEPISAAVAFLRFPFPFRRLPLLVEMRRIELLTPCVQGRCSPS